MLEKIYVDGFKSLKRFELNLNPGLNILVGPNGSGKTNIVSFFEFISFLSEGHVSEAAVKGGGVSSLFRRSGTSANVQVLHARLVGSLNTTYAHPTNAGTRKLRYEYEFEITLSTETGLIYFSKQVIRIASANRHGEFRSGGLFDSGISWDLEIESKANDTLRSDVIIRKIDFRKVRPSFVNPNLEKNNIIRGLKNRIERSDASSYSIISISESMFTPLRALKLELQSGRSFNIAPHIVKRREDAAAPTGVLHNGSGTSITLLTLWRVANKHDHSSRPPRIYSPNSRNRFLDISGAMFDDVVRLVKLVNRSIISINLSIDNFDNIIRIMFLMRVDGIDIEIPLQNMSDGTAKWLAMIVAILTNRSLFSIEEPENFLHPHMQKEILSIIRTNTERYRRRSFAIVTTHSETLLNAAKPDELVLLSMIDGCTIAKRVDDPALIAEAIRDSGFGLGYLYVADALSDD